MIFSWAQIGRSAIIGREMGSFFRGKKYSILASKIVICSAVDHCKMFYTPVPLLRVALVGEVGYNAVVPWIQKFFPLNVQFPHPLMYNFS